MTLIDNEAAALRTGGDEPPSFRAIYRAPIGEILLVAGEDGLRELRLPGPGADGDRPPAGAGTCVPLEEAVEQLEAYFAGELTNFDLPLVMRGTAFQRRVWGALADIPYGRTESYGSVATRVGNPKASRAVGMANNKNPLPIVLPCHRVIGANGKLVGYGGGLWMKEWLLGHEKAVAERGGSSPR
jgi:methylated-DNA-[protein]-cysteine S-methyltransferase